MNRKNLFLLAAFCGSITTISAQTLFTYGKYTADAKDFLRAYNKNNSAVTANKAKSVSDYLDLYVKSKLKVQETPVSCTLNKL